MMESPFQEQDKCFMQGQRQKMIKTRVNSWTNRMLCHITLIKTKTAIRIEQKK